MMDIEGEQFNWDCIIGNNQTLKSEESKGLSEDTLYLRARVKNNVEQFNSTLKGLQECLKGKEQKLSAKKSENMKRVEQILQERRSKSKQITENNNISKVEVFKTPEIEVDMTENVIKDCNINADCNIKEENTRLPVQIQNYINIMQEQQQKNIEDEEDDSEDEERWTMRDMKGSQDLMPQFHNLNENGKNVLKTFSSIKHEDEIIRLTFDPSNVEDSHWIQKEVDEKIENDFKKQPTQEKQIKRSQEREGLCVQLVDKFTVNSQSENEKIIHSSLHGSRVGSPKVAATLNLFKSSEIFDLPPNKIESFAQSAQIRKTKIFASDNSQTLILNREEALPFFKEDTKQKQKGRQKTIDIQELLQNIKEDKENVNCVNALQNKHRRNASSSNNVSSYQLNKSSLLVKSRTNEQKIPKETKKNTYKPTEIGQLSYLEAKQKQKSNNILAQAKKLPSNNQADLIRIQDNSNNQSNQLCDNSNTNCNNNSFNNISNNYSSAHCINNSYNTYQGTQQLTVKQKLNNISSKNASSVHNNSSNYTSNVTQGNTNFNNSNISTFIQCSNNKSGYLRSGSPKNTFAFESQNNKNDISSISNNNYPLDLSNPNTSNKLNSSYLTQNQNSSYHSHHKNTSYLAQNPNCSYIPSSNSSSFLQPNSAIKNMKSPLNDSEKKNSNQQTPFNQRTNNQSRNSTPINKSISKQGLDLSSINKYTASHSRIQSPVSSQQNNSISNKIPINNQSNTKREDQKAGTASNQRNMQIISQIADFNSHSNHLFSNEQIPSIKNQNIQSSINKSQFLANKISQILSSPHQQSDKLEQAYRKNVSQHAQHRNQISLVNKNFFDKEAKIIQQIKNERDIGISYTTEFQKKKLKRTNSSNSFSSNNKGIQIEQLINQ